MTIDFDECRQAWAPMALNELVAGRRIIEHDNPDLTAADRFAVLELIDELTAVHVDRWRAKHLDGQDIAAVYAEEARLRKEWEPRPMKLPGQFMKHRLVDPRQELLQAVIDARLVAWRAELEGVDIHQLDEELVRLGEDIGGVIEPRSNWSRPQLERAKVIEQAASACLRAWVYDLDFDELHRQFNAGLLRQRPETSISEAMQTALADRLKHHPLTSYRLWAPRRFWDADTTAAAAQLEAWADDVGGNLIVLGPVGTGKSYAAYGTCRWLAHEHGWACHMLTGPLQLDAGYLWDRVIAGGSWLDLLERLRPDGDLTIEHLVAPELLLLDDLGAERSTDWAVEQLMAVVDARWRDNLPIIATTNLEPVQLREAIGPRVYDRLRDDATTVTLKGGSKRKPRRHVTAVAAEGAA